MKPHLHLHLKRLGFAVITTVVMLVALSSAALAAPGGSRPGWGCGDDNHVHTGPPGRGSSSNRSCESHAQGSGTTRLTVSVPGSTPAGTAFSFTVTAVDRDGNTLASFGDTVHFSSSDGQASLPADSTLTNGTATFSATLRTAGNQTLTATDASNSSVHGTSGTVAVTPLAATHLSVSAPTNVSNGAAFTFNVTAQDQFNNTATGFADTVHFTTSDGSATLPADSTLANGTGTFTATLRTGGGQTITATDTSTASIAGSSTTITVS